MKLTESMKNMMVLDILADTPHDYSLDMMRDDATVLCVSRMPVAVRKLWDKNDTRPWVAMAHSATLQTYVPSGGIEHPEFVAMRARHKASESARYALRSNIKEFVYQFSTDAQLRSIAPELSKYLPKPRVVTKQLPVATGLVAALSKAGWPAGVSKCQSIK